MTEDARFEDGGEKPLNLGAFDVEDLRVLSALVQDAVLPITEMQWQARRRRFAMLVNRLRREDLPAAERAGRKAERVRAMLIVDHVLHVASQGIDRSDKDTVLQLLSVSFEAQEDGGGEVLLTLAGDGAIRLRVEALEVGLRDVTRPYLAPSGKVPKHPD
ncbi:DUF2948 family protein [Thalassococcus sp. CAU 1522]|uniref:DUF2948 family protein n=1 Tax=Thalassococcus arenae TaxID=2851652 RepID=A0ABS6N8P5_9RHOB|nr:DUF2948 family protein [Thalassococcus arenae]MBV2360382.1 DUF2948 family protein [Thalassococcus arenae]